MALPDSFWIGTTDLASITGVIVEDLSGIRAPGRRRTGSILVPYADGETAIDAPKFEAYDFEVGIALLSDESDGDSPASAHLRRAQLNANLAALTAVITGAWPNGHGAGKRRLAKSPSGYDEHTATLLYRDGLAIEELNYETGRTRLGFRNLTGYWLSGSTPVWP